MPLKQLWMWLRGVSQFSQVVVAPELFAQSGDFDFSAVTGMTITTDGTDAGAIIIDNVGFEPAV